MSDNRTPLDDFEAADLLHRMVWDLSQVRGETWPDIVRTSRETAAPRRWRRGPLAGCASAMRVFQTPPSIALVVASLAIAPLCSQWRPLRGALGGFGLAGLLLCHGAEALAQETVSHHGAWSVYCAENCWVATAASSPRGGVVLDPFAGSGTTLIAAERTGRIARLLELAPRYCDVIIRRWQSETGRQALREDSGEAFDAEVHKRKADRVEHAAV